jgi:hypothetical protein
VGWGAGASRWVASMDLERWRFIFTRFLLSRLDTSTNHGTGGSRNGSAATTANQEICRGTLGIGR